MVKSILVAALAATVLARPGYKAQRDEAKLLETRQAAGNSSLEAFIEKEFPIALLGAIKNIGGVNGSIVPAASPGIVVASPSTVNPDYFYTWTRDAALTQIMIVDELIFGTQTVGNNSLQVVLEQYGEAQAQLQTVTNPSGSLWPAGLGLGEPKFYTNLTRFDGAWGRPQNDGPALRAITMMELSNAIFLRNPAAAQIVTNVYWPLILNDLRYVGQYWNTTSYDLWEEVNGNSFFTTSAQHRALVQGSMLAARINQTCEPCQQAPNILCFLQSNFYNETGNYILANINANQVNRSQINADPILAAIHIFDINATCDAGALQPCNSRALATHKVWVDSFRNLYPINNNATAPSAVACGRYPEDVYYGSGENGLANPWYITTLAAAEMLYDAAAQFSKAGSITVDDTSIDFWQQFSSNITTGTYTNSSGADSLIAYLRTYADGFVGVVETYTPANGTLNEQFNKTTGEPVSAIALTWSYAQFVTMTERRNGQFPPSWGANTTLGTNVTEQCSIGSYNSTFKYQPAIAAGAMNISEPCLTNVLFQLQYVTGSGENTYIVGNTSLFGNTLDDPAGVIQVLRTGNYTTETPKWIEPAWVPAGVPIAYKYVLTNSTSGTFLFENITRYVTPPMCGNNTEQVEYSIGSFPPH